MYLASLAQSLSGLSLENAGGPIASAREDQLPVARDTERISGIGLRRNKTWLTFRVRRPFVQRRLRRRGSLLCDEVTVATGCKCRQSRLLCIKAKIAVAVSPDEMAAIEIPQLSLKIRRCCDKAQLIR